MIFCMVNAYSLWNFCSPKWDALKIFLGFFFLHQPHPLQSVCEWSLMYANIMHPLTLVNGLPTRNLARLTRTNIQPASWISVLQNHNTLANVDQICKHWCQNSKQLYYQHDYLVHTLVGLFGTSHHVLYHNMMKLCHYCASVLPRYPLTRPYALATK